MADASTGVNNNNNKKYRSSPFLVLGRPVDYNIITSIIIFPWNNIYNYIGAN